MSSCQYRKAKFFYKEGTPAIIGHSDCSAKARARRERSRRGAQARRTQASKNKCFQTGCQTEIERQQKKKYTLTRGIGKPDGNCLRISSPSKNFAYRFIYKSQTLGHTLDLSFGQPVQAPEVPLIARCIWPIPLPKGQAKATATQRRCQ